MSVITVLVVADMACNIVDPTGEKLLDKRTKPRQAVILFEWLEGWKSV
jgi:hypothetical protein